MLARSGGTPPYISSPLGNLHRNPFWAGKTSSVTAPPGWPSGSHPRPAAENGSGPCAPGTVGSDGRSAPDGWDRLAPGAAGPLPWQWQDIAFLQPPRSHKASRRLQLCFAQGCAAHTKRSWLSSVPGWEPTPERAGKKQQEPEVPASFPRLENPGVFAAACSSSSSRCSCVRPSWFLFPPCFSIVKSSPCWFFPACDLHSWLEQTPLNLSRAREVQPCPRWCRSLLPKQRGCSIPSPSSISEMGLGRLD